uniref:TPK_catalytic domain-containing protein n=1 Tax=Caenorhabditis japonica TaxID=281687 RepID=A0A8R1IAN2_CAEJA
MLRILQPFELFQKAASSVCIWLNGEPTAIGKRAETIWNDSKYRVATDGAINEIQKRFNDVHWPHIVCGDFDSLDKKIDVKSAE